MARSAPQVRPKTPTSSGRCGVVAATLAWSPPSNSSCIRSDRSSPPPSPCILSPRHVTSCGSGANGSSPPRRSHVRDGAVDHASGPGYAACSPRSGRRDGRRGVCRDRLRPARRSSSRCGSSAHRWRRSLAPCLFVASSVPSIPCFPRRARSSATGSRSYVPALSDEVIEIVAERGAHRSSRWTMLVIQHVGGAVRQVRPDATAFATRDAPFLHQLHGHLARPAGEPCSTSRGCVRPGTASSPHSTGAVYLNYLGQEEQGTDDAGAVSLRS